MEITALHAGVGHKLEYQYMQSSTNALTRSWTNFTVLYKQKAETSRGGLMHRSVFPLGDFNAALSNKTVQARR